MILYHDDTYFTPKYVCDSVNPAIIYDIVRVTLLILINMSMRIFSPILNKVNTYTTTQGLCR